MGSDTARRLGRALPGGGGRTDERFAADIRKNRGIRAQKSRGRAGERKGAENRGRRDRNGNGEEIVPMRRLRTLLGGPLRGRQAGGVPQMHECQFPPDGRRQGRWLRQGAGRIRKRVVRAPGISRLREFPGIGGAIFFRAAPFLSPRLRESPGECGPGRGTFREGPIPRGPWGRLRIGTTGRTTPSSLRQETARVRFSTFSASGRTRRARPPGAFGRGGRGSLAGTGSRKRRNRPRGRGGGMASV